MTRLVSSLLAVLVTLAGCGGGSSDEADAEASTSTSEGRPLVNAEPDLNLVAVIICDPERTSVAFDDLLALIDSSPAAVTTLSAYLVSSSVIHLGAASEEDGAEAMVSIDEGLASVLLDNSCYVED